LSDILVMLYVELNILCTFFGQQESFANQVFLHVQKAAFHNHNNNTL